MRVRDRHNDGHRDQHVGKTETITAASNPELPLLASFRMSRLTMPARLTALLRPTIQSLPRDHLCRHALSFCGHIMISMISFEAVGFSDEGRLSEWRANEEAWSGQPV